MKLTTAITLALWLAAVQMNASISVSPVALYLNDGKRSARVTVKNTSAEARVFEVNLRFGYPISDEDGNVTFQFSESTGTENSALDWTRVYPKTFELDAGETQTIMAIADPPAGLADGEYWLRPVVVSRPAAVGIQYGTSRESEGPSVHSVVLSMNFRHGTVATGASIENTIIKRVGEKLRVCVDLLRQGNAAYLGNIVCRLRNAQNRTMTDARSEIAVYLPIRKRLDLDVAGLPNGSYIMEVELNTYRKGNQPDDILQVPRVLRTVEYLNSAGSSTAFEESRQPKRHEVQANLIQAMTPESPSLKPAAQFLDPPTQETTRGASAKQLVLGPRPADNGREMSERVSRLETALVELVAAQAKLVAAMSALRGQ